MTMEPTDRSFHNFSVNPAVKHALLAFWPKERGILMSKALVSTRGC